MRNPAELHDGLADLAEPVTPAEGYEDQIMRRAERLRGRRRITAGAAAAVCLAVLVTMFQVVGFGSTPQLVASPPNGPFLGWSPVGNVDTGLVREATGVWDRSPAGPHTAVQALVATHSQRMRSAVVILQGYDKQGAARLAFFTGDSGAAGALRMRDDRPVPDPVETQVISLVSPRLTGAAGVVSNDSLGTYAIAVAMPGVTAVRVSSTAVDDEIAQDPDGSTGRLVVKRFPITATAQTTTIAGFIKPKRPFSSATKVFEVPGEGGVDRDARAVPAEVISRNGQQIVVAFPQDQGVRVGQLAVVAEGLVGRVKAVDAVRWEATVDLVTSSGFAGEVYTNISDVPGSVRGTGTKLVMENVPADGDVYESNRVLMPDPSQPNKQVGAITIGRVSADKVAGATTVELTPTADLASLTKLSIMTPSAD